MMSRTQSLVALVATLALSGCATTTQTTSVWPQDTLFDAPPPPRESVVDEWGQYHFTETTVYTGIKADRVGDLVVIRVSHSVNADSTATTSSNRTSTAEAAIETFLGIETVIPEIAPGFTPTASIGGSDTNQYSGDAGTNRSGRLQTTVTAKVLSVQPNNYLVVGARQQVKINNEVEIMWLFGLVDPRMIDPDNTISSRNIADLRMEYSGMGVVAEKQRPGWLTRALDVIRPF
jgi:flagellar L-ring protein precursor FlgH